METLLECGRGMPSNYILKMLFGDRIIFWTNLLGNLFLVWNRKLRRENILHGMQPVQNQMWSQGKCVPFFPPPEPNDILKTEDTHGNYIYANLSYGTYAAKLVNSMISSYVFLFYDVYAS